MDNLIELVAKKLREADSKSDPILVDFVLDEIYWEEIAKVAIKIIEEAPWELRSHQT